ncbi:MAG: BrnT family toxin [Candidatus Pacebacteria bacterium]|nr:BrnT family toxin [Candidatus Paceibacterota bacterium]
MTLRKLLKEVRGFDWDQGNTDKNFREHGVFAKEGEEVFFNEPSILFEDEKHSKKEKRYGIFGITSQKRKLTIIFTIRNKQIRIISARNMSQKERRSNEQKT